jgi:hypothetical protein
MTELITNSKFITVMQKRKQANWEGNDKEAAKLFRQAKSMVKRGEVSDEELEALAYI